MRQIRIPAWLASHPNLGISLQLQNHQRNKPSKLEPAHSSLDLQRVRLKRNPRLRVASSLVQMQLVKPLEVVVACLEDLNSAFQRKLNLNLTEVSYLEHQLRVNLLGVFYSECPQPKMLRKQLPEV